MLNTCQQIDYNCFTNQTKFFHSSLEEAFSSEVNKEFKEFLEQHNINNPSKRLYKNGSYSRHLSTPMGYLSIRIPRDRQSFFHPRFLPRYQRMNSSFKSKIDNIILKSFSFSSCVNTLTDLYDDKDFSISDKTVSRYAKAISKKLLQFNSSYLPPSLVAIYLDTTYFPFHLKNNSIKKIGLSIALGLTPEKNYQVLAYSLTQSESEKIYTALLENIRNRGVKSVDIIIGDGMPGIERASSTVFKNALFQNCLTHIERKFKRNIPDTILFPFTSDFLKITNSAQSYKEAIEQYNHLYNKYYSLSYLSPFWRIAPSNLFSYLKFTDNDLRIKIRTSNPIESLNSIIKRKIHNRISSSETTLILDLFAVFTNFNSNQINKSHQRLKSSLKPQKPS